MFDQLKTLRLYDLRYTLAAPLLEQTVYPWEALSGIRAFIEATGAALPAEEYDNPRPGVWIHKTAKVAPSAFLGDWVIIGPETEVRHCAFIRGSALVGAGAVVTHDVAPYEIVGGVPARHIGWRYPPELIAAMERIRWWDWSHDMLRERLRDFDDAAAFCRKFDPQ